MASFSDVFSRYAEKPLHFIAPMLFAFILSIASFFTALGLYLLTSMFLTLFNVPISAYTYFLGFYLALFILSLAGFKGGIIKGLEVALKGKRIKLMEFLSVAKRTAWPILAASAVRLALWLIFLSPAIYALWTGLEGWIVALVALFSLFLIAVVEYLLLPQYSLIVVLEEGLLASFAKAVKLSIRHWKAFIGPYLLLAVNFILKHIPLLNLISFFLLYPVAYAALIARVMQYGRR